MFPSTGVRRSSYTVLLEVSFLVFRRKILKFVDHGTVQIVDGEEHVVETVEPHGTG